MPALLNLRGIAREIGVSESTILRLLMEGLPSIDLTPSGARRKRLLRFDLEAVRAWTDCHNKPEIASDNRRVP